MHLLLNDYGGYPFPVDLGAVLAQRGHQVTHVYTSASGSPQGNFDRCLKGFRAVDITVPGVPKDDFRRRWLKERTYGQKTAELIRQSRPNVVLSANTPLEAQRLILRAARQVGAPFIFWWQDILSLAMEFILSDRLGVPGRWVADRYRRLEKELLDASAGIIAITEDHLDVLTDWKVSTPAVVIPNWAPLESIPVLPRDNAFARELNLVEPFVVLYSGTLGMKQNPDVLFETAVKLQSLPDVHLLVVAGGVAVEALKRRVEEGGLKNITIRPLVPFERVAEMLAIADVSLVMLRPEAGDYCVPSKVWSIYGSGRPVVAAMAASNAAARLTEDIGAGVVVDPPDAESIVQEIKFLKDQPSLRDMMGRQGRQYAEQMFQIEVVTDRFLAMIEQVLIESGEEHHLAS